MKNSITEWEKNEFPLTCNTPAQRVVIKTVDIDFTHARPWSPVPDRIGIIIYKGNDDTHLSILILDVRHVPPIQAGSVEAQRHVINLDISRRVGAQ